MATLTERFHNQGFLISEAPGHQSRDKVTILSGENLRAGAVIAKITASGKYVAIDHAMSAEADGTTTAAGVLLEDCDASSADTIGVAILRNAEVNQNELVWPDAMQESEKAAARTTLRTLGIISRP